MRKRRMQAMRRHSPPCRSTVMALIFMLLMPASWARALRSRTVLPLFPGSRWPRAVQGPHDPLLHHHGGHDHHEVAQPRSTERSPIRSCVLPQLVVCQALEEPVQKVGIDAGVDLGEVVCLVGEEDPLFVTCHVPETSRPADDYGVSIHVRLAVQASGCPPAAYDRIISIYYVISGVPDPCRPDRTYILQWGCECRHCCGFHLSRRTFMTN